MKQLRMLFKDLSAKRKSRLSQTKPRLSSGTEIQTIGWIWSEITKTDLRGDGFYSGVFIVMLIGDSNCIKYNYVRFCLFF